MLPSGVLFCRFPVQWLGRQADDKQRTAILRQLQPEQEPAAGFSYGLWSALWSEEDSDVCWHWKHFVCVPVFWAQCNPLLDGWSCMQPIHAFTVFYYLLHRWSSFVQVFLVGLGSYGRINRSATKCWVFLQIAHLEDNHFLCSDVLSAFSVGIIKLTSGQ